MTFLPFAIRRVMYLIRGVFINRDRPRLSRLAKMTNPEGFVWAILPHAARSFAPSILLLPRQQSLVAAVGYLYARMLDTYEDLSATESEAREALSAFSARFRLAHPDAAPPAPVPQRPDARDRTHLMLIDRHPLVDEVFMGLGSGDRQAVVALVGEMANAMSRYSKIFEDQGGVLENDIQVLEYCHGVIGLPALFVLDLLIGDPADHQTDALEVSELIQLANITRDIEKDMQRGVAYHPRLRRHLGSSDADPETAQDISIARHDLTTLATKRATSVRRLIDAVSLPRISAARSAAVLLMLFTNRHYRDMRPETKVGRGSAPRRPLSMVLTALPAAFSPRWADNVFRKVEQEIQTVA